MTPRPTSDELWGHHSMPSPLALDVLMPNGIVITLSCNRDATLDAVKTNLWAKAKEQVLFRLLSEPTCYIFVAVTQDAKLVEFYDETRRLCDLRLFLPLLKVVEPEGNKEEKILNSEISLAIGKPVHEFDAKKETEFVECRRSLLTLCRATVEEREGLPLERRLCNFFPPELEVRRTGGKSISKSPQESGQKEVQKSPEAKVPPVKEIKLCIWSVFSQRGKQSQVFKTTLDTKPSLVIKQVLEKDKNLISFDEQTSNQAECEAGGGGEAQKSQVKFVLKVCGLEEYLLNDYSLGEYKYINRCISQDKTPQLILKKESELLEAMPRATFLVPSFLKRLPPQPTLEQESQLTSQSIQSSNLTSLWKVDVMFRVHIISATYVNVKDVDKIYVKTGLFLGPESLCSTTETEQVEPQKPKWDQWLDYDIHYEDIPRGARLCLSICSVSSRKKKEECCALAWGNISLFDFKDKLLTERVSINLWSMPKGHDELLYPLGATGSNENKDSPCLELEFEKLGSVPVVFPPADHIQWYAEFVMNLAKNKRNPGHKDFRESRMTLSDGENDKRDLELIIRRDPLAEMSEQEKDLVWRMRNYCLNALPDSLPKLIDSVKWNSRDEVSQLYVLLRNWKGVTVDTALELLDCKYADLTVRSFAVKWLNLRISDHMLSQYLLQLVQVVMNEPHLDNDLSRFLIRRALLNRNIGHYFFWHLKAEAHNPRNGSRCSLLLEAFCRGLSSSLLKATIKQVEALEKLTKLTDILKERRDATQKERIHFLREQIKQRDYMEALNEFHSPLNYRIFLGQLRVSECRIMDSAKRPLWLVWDNPDPTSDGSDPVIAIIFKNGDDLRQDMLTLQVIRIMDSIWRSEGHDFKMLPYRCLATGYQVGMIEVVKQAKTVMNIQRACGRRAAFQVGSKELHRWVKETTRDRYDQAIATFSDSCAGYCVATFILGIGDRNPDNIMINEEGQIFHIDFGHFLGHFKKKFGINRERVPFVLTDDFLFVICRGVDYVEKSPEYVEFNEKCRDAYLSLRRHANLLITLFTMMLSTGIPELQSIDDIGYLRTTLQVDKSEAEALSYFAIQMQEAMLGSIYTKFDWLMHQIKHSK